MDALGLARHPGETDVLGDIEHWADAYLDSGLHLQDWDQRIRAQQALFDAFIQAPLGFLPHPASPRPPEDGV